MLKRIKSIRTASHADGMKGIKHNKILDGICVKTIVLINPIFAAIRTASKAEIPARILAPKKILPRTEADPFLLGQPLFLVRRRAVK